MISVIVPALNESNTIESVIAFARRSPLVKEVLVVDDGSLDATAELARDAGARVLTSSLMGKGASMEDGVRAASESILLYLDGDLASLQPDLIPRMAAPLLADQADFVKARFTRAAGRVTTLTAKPLLRTFFPELSSFEQPLGGIIAARRSLLQGLRFENDYGVDIGLLLDVVALGARLTEVDVGHIEHESQPLSRLGDMAMQVARTILDRAARYGRFSLEQLREVEEMERHDHTEFNAVLQKMGRPEHLALFDMDGTLLQGRFITQLARETGTMDELLQFLDNHAIAPEDRTAHIARLFAGISKDVFESVARSIPLMPGVQSTIVGLRRAGFRVGIITDSFCIAAETVRRRVFADFALTHLLAFHQGKATGDVTLCPAMFHPNGCAQHRVCKHNLLPHLREHWDLEPEQILMVGDGENDICLLRSCGMSVAYRPKTRRVQSAASHVLFGSMMDLLDIVGDEILRASA